MAGLVVREAATAALVSYLLSLALNVVHLRLLMEVCSARCENMLTDILPRDRRQVEGGDVRWKTAVSFTMSSAALKMMSARFT